MSAPADASTEPAAPRGGFVVLHVVESWGAGTRAAVLRMVAATPHLEHHLLRATTRAEFDARGEERFASVTDLPVGLIAGVRAVRRVARERRPEVVHAHSSMAGVVTRLALRPRPDRRVVYSPHCFAFERRDLAAPLRAAVRLAERMLATRTDAIAACSPAEAATAARWGRRVVLVPNLADPAEATPPADVRPRTPGVARVVGVGRLGAQKDPDFFRAVIAALPAGEVEAAWIGGGDPARAARLEAAGVAISGWLPAADAAARLAAADLLVYSAAWDGFPLAILEAVALGVPVVARDVPSLAGATATPGLTTPADVAAAVTALRAGGAPARAANLAAWRRLLADNTPERVAATLDAAYRPPTRHPLLLNGKWLSARPSGMQRFAGEVGRRLLALDPSARVAVPRDAVLPPWLPPHRVDRLRTRGIVFEQLGLAGRAGGRLLVNLAGPAPLLRRRQLVVMHDATPMRHPETFSRAFVAWYRLMYGVLARTARHLATVSEFSRGELAAVLGVPAERFLVAYDGHEHALAALGDADPEPVEGEYLLCIGNLTPSKNLAPVTRALAAAGERVIVVGATGPRRVYTAAEGLDVPGVELAGRLDDAELARLLRDARALVFPSLYEGFGLPIVEAQAIGCPVIASTAASIPEVAGDAALYFDPRDPESAVARVRDLTDAERSRLRERGRANVVRFSWDDSAAAILRRVSGTGDREGA